VSSRESRKVAEASVRFEVEEAVEVVDVVSGTLSYLANKH